MSKNDEINKLKKLFEIISIKFDEAMDYISNINIKNDEYKQMLSGITKNINDLDQKLLDLASFSPPEIEDKGEEPNQELANVLDALDAIALEKPEKIKTLRALPSDQKPLVMKKMEKEKIVQAPILPPKPINIPESDSGLTSVPKMKKLTEKPTGLTPVPKFNGKLKTTPKPQQEVRPHETPAEKFYPQIEPDKKIEKTLEKIPEKRINLQNTDDVFYNLMIDIDLSENFKQLGSNIRLAAEFLKQFVKFHKVLFDMLKTASDTNKQKGDLTKEYKEKIKQRVKDWGREIYFV